MALSTFRFLLFVITGLLVLGTLQVCFGFLSNGVVMAWPSPMLPKLEAADSQVPVSRTQASWMVTAASFGGLLAPVIGLMSDRFGRKPMLLVTAIPLIANCIITLLATSPELIIVARTMAGIAVTSVYIIGPVYIGEVAHESIRGILGSMLDLFYNIGFLFTYCVGPYTSYTLFNGLCCICPALFLFFVLFIPETPYYLLKNNKREFARLALMRLRNVSPQNIQKELDKMESMVIEQTKNPGTLRDLFTNKASRRGLLVTVGLVTTLQFSGVMAIVSYAQSIFDMAPGLAVTSSQCAIIVGVIQVTSGTITVTLVDRVGRRPLLMASTLGCGISLCILGTYLYLKDKDFDVSGFEWIPLTCLVLFMVMVTLGLSPVPNVILGEIFPSNVKDLAVSISIITTAASFGIVTKSYQIMLDSIGPYAPFWFFSTVVFCGFVFVYFLVPETKGKLFETIIAELNGESKTTDLKQVIS